MATLTKAPQEAEYQVGLAHRNDRLPGRNRMQTKVLAAVALLACVSAIGQETDEPPGREHSIPLFMAHMDPEGRQGFIRIINHSDEAGTVEIEGVDDAGMKVGPVELSIGARETKHLNSEDLELGNTDKGLDGELGDGQGNWRLLLKGGGLDIEPLTYIRTGAGFLTSMNDVVPEALRNHRVPIFNPGTNMNQRSWLRLINPGDVEAAVTITGRDDAALPDGEDDPVPTYGPFELTIPAQGAQVLTAQDLEDGTTDSAGIGDGTGKWSLDVGSNVPIQVVNLMSTAGGYLSNLSAANPGYRGATGLWQVTFSDEMGGEGYIVMLPDSRLYAWLPESDEVNRIARGTFEPTPEGIAGEGELYESGAIELQGLTPVGGSEDFTLTATYRSGDWIRGQYAVGGTSRTFRGWAFTGFERGGAASAIARLWQPLEGDDADLNASFEPTDEGELDFSFEAGSFTCTVKGPIGPVNPAFSVYEAEVIITCSLLVFTPLMVDLILAVYDSPARPGSGNHAVVLAIIHPEANRIGFGSLFRIDEDL